MSSRFRLGRSSRSQPGEVSKGSRSHPDRGRPYLAMAVVVLAIAGALALAAVVLGASVLAGLRSGGTTAPPLPEPVATATSTARAHPLRIMPLGSSSTVGCGSPATAGFRGPLETLLARDGIAFDLVGSQRSGPPSVPDRDHEGHDGWTMVQMQPLVAGWVRAQRPDVILLQVGTNDLLTGATGRPPRSAWTSC